MSTDQTLVPAVAPAIVPEARDQLLQEAKSALNRIFTTTTLSTEQRFRSAKKLNAAVRQIEYEAGRAELISWPAQVELPVAGKCNLRCTMCSLSHGAPMFPNWTIDEVKRFEPFFRYATQVNPTGVGEPLSNRDIVPMLKLFQQYQLGAGFYSNATLLTDEKIDALIEHGLTQLNVSIDGATKETFERVRRYAKYDVVVGNVRRFVARRRALGKSLPRLQIAMVLMLDTMHELPDLIRLAADIGADSIFTNFVTGGAPGMEPYHDPVRTNAILREARDLAREFGLPIQMPEELPEEVVTPVDEALRAPEPMAPKNCKCSHPWMNYLVHNDGQVGPCCRIKGELDGFSFGSIQKSSPVELWNSPGMIHLRQRLLSDDAPDVCRSCTIRQLSVK